MPEESNVWDDQKANLALKQMLSGKIARVHYQEEGRNGKKIDRAIELGNFSEVYSQLEQSYKIQTAPRKKLLGIF